jgi:hypothetical protein
VRAPVEEGPSREHGTEVPKTTAGTVTPGSPSMYGRGPLPWPSAGTGLLRCVAATAELLARRRTHLPRQLVGTQLRFADGTTARVFRETTVDRDEPQNPCLLVVRFRLRLLRGRWHRLFLWECILNTPLFVGFPGFVSKLWLRSRRPRPLSGPLRVGRGSECGAVRRIPLARARPRARPGRSSTSCSGGSGEPTCSPTRHGSCRWTRPGTRGGASPGGSRPQPGSRRQIAWGMSRRTPKTRRRAPGDQITV